MRFLVKKQNKEPLAKVLIDNSQPTSHSSLVKIYHIHIYSTSILLSLPFDKSKYPKIIRISSIEIVKEIIVQLFKTPIV